MYFFPFFQRMKEVAVMSLSDCVFALKLPLRQKESSQCSSLVSSELVTTTHWIRRVLFPCRCSLFHSETTWTDPETKSSAWRGWQRTSSPRSPTNCCPSWKVEESNRGWASLPRRFRNCAMWPHSSPTTLLPPPPHPKFSPPFWLISTTNKWSHFGSVQWTKVSSLLAASQVKARQSADTKPRFVLISHQKSDYRCKIKLPCGSDGLGIALKRRLRPSTRGQISRVFNDILQYINLSSALFLGSFLSLVCWFFFYFIFFWGGCKF